MTPEEAVILCRYVKAASPAQQVDEEWRPIPGHEGYEASSLGRLRSWRTHRGVPGPRILRSSPDDKGYLTTRIYGGKGRTYKIHVLIALAFHGPRPEGMQVRHLDSDQLNNAASNLAYGTQFENMRDRTDLRTHCKNGHEYNDENTVYKPGRRVCKPCQRDADRRRRPRKAA